MSWFSLALALLGLAKAVFDLVEKRKAEHAAEATAILKLLDQLNDVRKAERDARARVDRGELSDDDFRD